MKKKLLLATLFTILSIKSFSQINFEKGYFINESNQKTECLIKNNDWGNNPFEFEYKLTPESEINKAFIQNIKEFGIYNYSKYIRAQVKIDRSSDNLNNLSADRNPIFNDEQLFLKVLVEGNATLFVYLDKKNAQRFFYQVKKDAEINQLVYKLSLIEGRVFENNYFRRQLLKDFQNDGIFAKNVEKMKYKQWELESFFTKLNKSTDSKYVDYELKPKKDLFNLTIRPGLNSSSLSIEHDEYFFNKMDFENQSSFRLGIEAEFILPFNKNKWSIAVEPTYQSYKAEKSIKDEDFYYDPNAIFTAKVDYTSIEIPISIRHYFFINDNSKIFINAFLIIDIESNSKIEFTRTKIPTYKKILDINSGSNLGFGSGYKFKDKYSFEMRYNVSRSVLANTNWKTDYSSLNVILGYSLF